MAEKRQGNTYTHYNIAYGSICELETQILISRDLDYIEPEAFNVLQREIGDVERMLKGLIKSLSKIP